jgi:hypothetical protein
MVISLGKVFEPFVAQRPICVMARGVLENLFNADKIDALFARTAEVQYTRELLFSSVVDLMGQVVLGVQPSVHAAYQAQAAQLGISDQAIYDKRSSWIPGSWHLRMVYTDDILFHEPSQESNRAGQHQESHRPEFYHVRWNFVKGWTHTPNIRSTNSRMDSVWLDLPELPHAR